MSRWRAVVRRELARYREQTGATVVERQELLDQFLPVLRREFPDNNHPGQKFSQILQQLRDRGEIDFLGEGTYDIRALDAGKEASGDAGEAAAGETPTYETSEYRTTVGARSLPRAFRTAVLARYDHTCPVSGVDHDRLLDVAHVLSWSDHPERRGDLDNVLALSKTHHAAFDAGLFTLDADLRLRVSPEFDADSRILRRTLLDRDGERVDVPAGATIAEENLRTHNRRLDWW